MDIRNFLNKNKIIKRDFAFLVDMNETTLCSYTYRKTTPSVLSALKILHASNFEIDLKTLLSRSDEDNFLRWKKGYDINRKLKIENFIEESEDLVHEHHQQALISENVN